ncbi:MAG: 2Fe-2S iron-sulfur cluster binding domain-containing protein, partial [Cycloclasticus sp.]
YPCAETKHLLAGMIQLGKKGIPVGCRSGGCGVCKVQVLSGDYTSKKMSRDHVTEEEEGRGIVLACRVFPQSDITLSVIGHLRKAVMR